MGIFNVGVSGLGAAQAGILTTSHNIANASTPGYSRQQIQQTTNTPMFSGAGYLGQGTNVETIRRVYSQQLTEQVLSAQTGAAEMDSYLSQIDQISNLLADPDAGLSPALADFFKAVQEMAANPSSIPARQAMLSSSESLVSRFEAIDQRMAEIRNGVNAQISGKVGAINAYAEQIAEINQRIVYAQSAGPNQPPNDLLDQRDQLVAELNKEIRVTTIEQNDGTYSVFIGNGQPLVVGTFDYSLQAVAAPDNPERMIVAMQSPSGTPVNIPESLLTGGELGGLIAFRSESLDSAQNALGRIALTLATNFNTQHRLGQDLTGALGGDYFDLSLSGPTVRANSTNSGSGTVTASIDAATIDKLTTSDYLLTYNGTGNYTVTRLSDNAAVVNGTPLPPTIEGFSIAVGGTPDAGDSFLIQPTRAAAANLAMAISDPRSIAAASPMRTGTPLTNTGTATIDPGSVTDAALWNNPLNSKDLEVGFWVDTAGVLGTANATYYDLVDAATGKSLFTNTASTTGLAGTFTHPYVSGQAISFSGLDDAYGTDADTIDDEDFGIAVTITGVPANGDAFSVARNAYGVSDNRNGVLLGALQTQSTMASGTATYQSAYSQIVAEVGTKARQVEIAGQAQQSLLERAQATRDQLSGVNLDEEAANLLRYQQAYQAAARMLDIASSLFDEILALGR